MVPIGHWWKKKPYRLIQTNLREIDVRLDVEAYIASLQSFHAEVLLLNTGGIAANYPTELPFQYRNPHLINDFVGEVVRQAHRAGIRVIARFDFSRLNESIALRHEDWLYRSVQGSIVNYNGQVHTCLNGFYQQHVSIDIMTEAASRYPVDGVFINMHGYVLRDYSGVEHGICQCGSCRTRFRDMFGRESLPVAEDIRDPVFRDYHQFRIETVKELFLRRSRAVKAINADIAMCNYTPEGSDIYRIEANTGIERRLPEFNYAAGQHAKFVRQTWPSMAMSGSAVHFVDYAMRHSAVSPHHTALRLAQTIVQGGWPDFYVIGTLLNQDDRFGLDEVRELFRYHREHEAEYTGLESTADICLLQPKESKFADVMSEFKGLYRILSENHHLFDVMEDSVLDLPEAAERLARYRLLVLPDLRNMSEAACRRIDAFVREGGRLLATGATGTRDGKGAPLHRFAPDCLGAAAIKTERPLQKGTYFRVRDEDKRRMNGFDKLDLVYLHGEYVSCEPKPGCVPLLGYVPPAMIGPPEKCYIATVTDEPGMLFYPYREGATVLIPWGIGKHYERLSQHGHALLVLAAVRDLLETNGPWSFRASPLLEFTAHRQRAAGRELLHAVNLSGQLGTAFHPPVPIHDSVVRFRASRPVERIAALRGGADLPFREDGQGAVEFRIPVVELLETVVIHYRDAAR